MTKDVPDYAIVAGNPAKVIRSRKTTPALKGSLESRLLEFGEQVSSQLDQVVNRCSEFSRNGDFFLLDQPKQSRRIRPWCDAIEIFSMFDRIPPQWDKDVWIERLREFQDPRTGLVPEFMEQDRHLEPSAPENPVQAPLYNTMIVNYALECLGSNIQIPVSTVASITEDRLIAQLAELPWTDKAWFAGNWIDCYATCLMIHQRHFGYSTLIDRLLNWLDRNCDPERGVWGQPTQATRWLEPVNGFYRITRGTYAQFGCRVPFPMASIDTIMTHMNDVAFFSDDRANACNYLDVVHPLWLCFKQTSYRRPEAESWVWQTLPKILDQWKDGQGFAFDFAKGGPGLQGTEMWLSIIHLMTDMIGFSDQLCYQPRGVHRLAPVPLTR